MILISVRFRKDQHNIFIFILKSRTLIKEGSYWSKVTLVYRDNARFKTMGNSKFRSINFKQLVARENRKIRTARRESDFRKLQNLDRKDFSVTKNVRNSSNISKLKPT